MIPLDEPIVGDREIEYLTDCIRSGWISWQGPYVGAFEKRAAQYIGVQHAVSTCNGTAALIVALQALGIGEGDEVIVPTLTFSASVWAIVLAGGVPVLADSLSGRFSVDPADIARRITPRTRALLVVHLYGHPVDMDPIMDLAKTSGLRVVEDVAQAFGADYKGRKVGGIGDIGCVSFHNKLIATGEGGMILTSSAQVAQRVAALRTPSPDNRTDFSDISLNFRMSNLTAAVGLAQLERLEETLAAKRAIAHFYDAAFRGSVLETIGDDEGSRGAYWRSSALTTPRTRMSRDRLADALGQHGITARASYQPMHLHPTYRDSSSQGFPNAERVSLRGIDLPSSPRLTTAELTQVADTVLRLANQ